MTSPDPSMPAANALYRAIWRWHFYAGLIVAPILLVMAITGSIYLFNSEIDDLLHHDRRFVTVEGAAMPASHSIAAAMEAQKGAESFSRHPLRTCCPPSCRLARSGATGPLRMRTPMGSP